MCARRSLTPAQDICGERDYDNAFYLSRSIISRVYTEKRRVDEQKEITHCGEIIEGDKSREKEEEEGGDTHLFLCSEKKKEDMMQTLCFLISPTLAGEQYLTSE